ncbi:2-nitropropane dioxygenase [Actinoalloteichus sp. AHMU CJ021]|uniref:Propionate 3-nitronate monooxygenase n=1 Tax=Actinoalloteichus caeruleus DSM 43889 TaxID=1120930 RepID=A0ABT1JPP5_ACTCY|nr:nitronate monooxygenase [Actinoalloteichus caeruleus]AUS79928.1 2-nitropropane dioxygenase [Actinoalloteichus sp. AHMU CJ021]MCP2334108.1 nitroalkane oxidase (EC 1.7.3.1) [Actinoalloteichus caeruleus DSM 43889]
MARRRTEIGVGEFDELTTPVVAAPMAGGASTPDLVVAVNSAGGLGFLAGGYRSAQEMLHQVSEVRGRTDRAFGVNLFVPGEDRAVPAELDEYRRRLAPEAARVGVELGEPRWDDDGFPAKLAALLDDPVPVVSFTFGLPDASAVRALRRAGSLVVVTVTCVEEARAAAERGADALCVQGAEAGGHQGSFDDTEERVQPLASLLAAVRASVPLPLLAAGGLASPAAVRAALGGGAVAVQVGTALLLADESGASATHRAALVDPEPRTTRVTRAFSGRRARGLVNRFLAAHDEAAPAAYPQVHRMTAPLRAAAARAGDTGTTHLWAGTGFRSASARPAAAICQELVG